MAKKAGIWDQERDKEQQDDWRDPGWDLGCSNRKVRIRFVGLDSFDCDQGEYPYT